MSGSVPRPLPSPPPLGTVLGPNQRPALGGPSRERGKSFEIFRSNTVVPPRRTDDRPPERLLPVNPPSFSRSSSNETSSSGRRPAPASTDPSSSSGARLLPSALPASPQPPPPRPLRSNSDQQILTRPPNLPSSSPRQPSPPGPSSPVPLPKALPVDPLPDSPTFRSQIVSLSMRLGDIKSHVKTVQRSASAVSELIRQLSDAEDELAIGMQELAQYMTDPGSSPPRSSGSYRGLKRVWGDEQGVCGRRRAERREERAALEKTVVGPLRDYYERVKESEKDKLTRKGYEDESKAYLGSVAKYLSAPPSRDSPKLDAAFRARNQQWDLYRFEVESSLVDLTLGPRFHQLYVHLLTFPSNLANFAPPASSARDELAQTLSRANQHNFEADKWWEQRQRAQRTLQEAVRGDGSALVEEDWDHLDHGGSDSPFVGGHERKRDRLGSKLRAAFNLPASGQGKISEGVIAQTIAQPFKSFNNRSASPTHSPVADPNLPTPPPAPISSSTLPLPPLLSPLSMPPPSSSSSPTSAHPQPSVASPEVKRPNRHSIQVLPKSYSSAGLTGASGSGGANALKGIRDLDDRWADLREKEGRKKEGYLWCAGGSTKSGGDGSGSRGGNWERCWCEVKQSHLIEYRSGQEGIEYASTTDLMFASAREARKSDRRFVIELITRKSTRRFQATSELEMQRWLAALGNAIEASINGTASIRGTSGSSVPTLSSIDDLGLIKPGQYSSSRGLGLGLPVENRSHDHHHHPHHGASSNPSSSTGFPFRAWGNPLSRKTSMTHKRPSKGPPSHGHSPSEGGAAFFSGAGPGAGRAVYEPVSSSASSSSHSVIPPYTSPTNRHRTSTFNPGPTFQLTTPSPAPSPPLTAKKLHLDPSAPSTFPYLSQVASPSRLSMTMDRSESDSGTGGPGTGASSSRSSSFLNVDDLDGIERRVNEMAGGLGSVSLNGRRALSEGSTFAGNGTNGDRLATEPHALPSISEISRRQENATCVDCRKPNPRWATIAIQDQRIVAFLCISCSGIHRSLGSHISKVRSVDLDNWKDEDILAADQTGNAYVNEIWEAMRPEERDRANMKTFIQAKYVDSRWKS